MVMTSAERVRTALGQREADRVPWFLPVTMHGALETGVPLVDYYHCAQLVAEGQLRLRAKYGDDLLYAFFHGAVEFEAFGGEVTFRDDGPPTAAGPLFGTAAEVSAFTPPRISEAPALRRVLDAIDLMAAGARGEAPIVAVVMGPASLPILQLGYDQYIELIQERPDLIEGLLRRNATFTVEWANAQLDAGADIVAYFDPVAAPTVLAPELAADIGIPLMNATMSGIHGPCAAVLASAHSLAVVPELANTRAIIATVADDEHLGAAKAAAAGRITVMGNLSGLQMRHWSSDEAGQRVRDAVLAGAPGGGFILSDAHGEIPLDVREDVLLSLGEAVREHGTYPIGGPPG